MYLFIYKVFKYTITLQRHKIAKNCAYEINVALKLVLLLDLRSLLSYTRQNTSGYAEQ